MVGDGHAMGVAAEILQHLMGPRRQACIDHPVLPVEAAEQFGELLWIGQSGGGSGAA